MNAPLASWPVPVLYGPYDCIWANDKMCIHNEMTSYKINNFVVNFKQYSVSQTKDKLQEWTEHWGTDHWKFRTSRDNQKIISTSFEHLKKCINFQN